MGMEMLMKNILDIYGYGIIQDCHGVIKNLEKAGISQVDFFNFIEKAKKSPPEKTPTKKVKKIKKTVFLKPGETEKMTGVKCEKCSETVYIEGICPRNPLFSQGFVRKGICGTCGNEFGIR